MTIIDKETSIDELQILLNHLGWINDEQIIDISVPGAGNMNVVLRVKTNKRSFILKQSRPYVQKYQDIAAPIERINTEYQFYQAITCNSDQIASYVPEMLYYDDVHHLLMMEDLGDCEDMSTIYAEKAIDESALKKLIKVISLIHSIKVPCDFPSNDALRELNHQHIFVLPFMEDNGFHLDDVQDGLQQLSMSYKKDEELKRLVSQIGNQYLESGNTLLHGDYYPGSWMKKEDQVYVLDPEFCFAGFKEFDLGVMIAHIIISTGDPTFAAKVIDLYNGACDKSLVNRIAGIEIMRRIIGLAQLPLTRSIEEKEQLLNIAYKMIIN